VAYIGRPSIVGNFVKLDAISVVNGQAAYTMQNGSANFTDYSSVNQFMVSLNGTIQSPGSSFTVSGSTITFASNLVTNDVIDFIIVFGNSLSSGVPTDATVSTAKIVDDAVTSAKISDANITSAKIAGGVLQPPHRNIIINGDMSQAQRATSASSLTGSGFNTVDRFQTALTTLGTWTQSQSTTVPTGQGFAKSFKMDCTTADASPAAGDRIIFVQRIEGQNLQYIKKGTSSAESLTISFWVRSNKTGTYIVELMDDDNSFRHINKSYTISSADTWEKKEITFAGDTTGTLDNDNAASLEVSFYLGAGSTITSGTLQTSWGAYTAANRAVGQVNLADSTSNEWYVTGIQLEAGTAASDFEFLPVDVNLQRCQRYYEKSYSLGTAPATATDTGRHAFFFNTTHNSYAGGFIKYVVQKRATPTITTYAPGNGTSGQGSFYEFGSSTTNAALTVGQENEVGFTVYRTGTNCNAMALHYQTSSEL